MQYRAKEVWARQHGSQRPQLRAVLANPLAERRPWNREAGEPEGVFLQNIGYVDLINEIAIDEVCATSSEVLAIRSTTKRGMR